MQSVLKASAPDAGRRRWFAAGEAVLAIDIDEAVPTEVSDLHDAALLGSVDALLCEIEHRSGREYDWAPVSAPSASLAVSVAGAGLPTVAVSLPKAEHERLCFESASEAGFAAGITVREHRVAATVTLDRFHMQDEDRARLQPGAVVLLPASFASTWMATLDVPSDTSLAVSASVDAETGRVIPVGRIDAVASSAGQACVTLDRNVDLSLDKIDSAEPVAAALDDGVAVQLSVELEGEGALHFSGRLLALGRGHAIVIGER